jgi:hypothetical protein
MDVTNLLETIYYSLNFLIYCCLIGDMRQMAASITNSVQFTIKSAAPWRRRTYNMK